MSIICRPFHGGGNDELIPIRFPTPLRNPFRPSSFDIAPFPTPPRPTPFNIPEIFPNLNPEIPREPNPTSPFDDLANNPFLNPKNRPAPKSEADVWRDRPLVDPDRDPVINTRHRDLEDEDWQIPDNFPSDPDDFDLLPPGYEILPGFGGQVLRRDFYWYNPNRNGKYEIRTTDLNILTVREYLADGVVYSIVHGLRRVKDFETGTMATFDDGVVYSADPYILTSRGPAYDLIDYAYKNGDTNRTISYDSVYEKWRGVIITKAPGLIPKPPPPDPDPPEIEPRIRGESKPDTDPRNDFDPQTRPRSRPKIEIKTPGDLDRPIDLNKRPTYKDRVIDPNREREADLPPEFLPWIKPWDYPPEIADLPPGPDLDPLPPDAPLAEPSPDTESPWRDEERWQPTFRMPPSRESREILKERDRRRNPPFTVDLRKPFGPESETMPTQTQPWGQCSCPKQTHVDLEDEEMITYVNVPVEVATAEFDEKKKVWVTKKSTKFVPVLQLKTGSESKQIQEEYKHRNQMVQDLVDLKNKESEAFYGIPQATFDETVVYHPQLFLEFRGDKKLEMQVSFRLLANVKVDDRTLQDRIGREFGKWEFFKGIYRASFHDAGNGMRLIIPYREAKQVEELIKKLFRLINKPCDLAWLKMDARAIAKTGQYTPDGKVKPKYKVDKTPGRRRLVDRRVGKVKLNRAYALSHGAEPKLIWHSNPLKNPLP